MQFLILHTLLRRRHAVDAFDDTTARGCLRIAWCSAAMAASLIATRLLLPAPSAWWSWAWQTALLVAVGGGVFLAVAVVLRLPELRWLVQRGPAGGAGAYLTD